jgi:hypothetical protein
MGWLGKKEQRCQKDLAKKAFDDDENFQSDNIDTSLLLLGLMHREVC